MVGGGWRFGGCGRFGAYVRVGGYWSLVLFRLRPVSLLHCWWREELLASMDCSSVERHTDQMREDAEGKKVAEEGGDEKNCQW